MASGFTKGMVAGEGGGAGEELKIEKIEIEN
jgi:hypothetical protein